MLFLVSICTVFHWGSQCDSAWWVPLSGLSWLPSRITCSPFCFTRHLPDTHLLLMDRFNQGWGECYPLSREKKHTITEYKKSVYCWSCKHLHNRLFLKWMKMKSLSSRRSREFFKGTGLRFSTCTLIYFFSNLLLILLVNNPTHMYLSDLRVYFKVEVYFRVTWSGMEEY